MNRHFLIYISLISMFMAMEIYLLCIKQKNQNILKYLKIILLALTGLYLFLVLGILPFNSGNDIPRYIYAFNKISSLFSAYKEGSSSFGSKEPLFWFFVGILKTLNTNPRFLLDCIFCSIILEVGLFYWILTSKHIKPYFFIIFPSIWMTYYLVYSGNMLRQALVTPLVLLSLYTPFNQEKPLKAITLIFILSLIHWSAIIYGIISYIFLKTTRFLLIRKESDYNIHRSLIIMVILILLTIGISEIILIFSRKLPLFKHNLNSNYGIVFEFLMAKLKLYFKNKFAFTDIANLSRLLNYWLIMISSLTYFVVFFLKARHNDLQRFLLSMTLTNITIINIFFFFPQIGERFFPYALLITPFQSFEVFYFVYKKTRLFKIFYVYPGLFFLQGTILFKTKSVLYTLGLGG